MLNPETYFLQNPSPGPQVVNESDKLTIHCERLEGGCQLFRLYFAVDKRANFLEGEKL